jgi:hypothetical protein
MRTMKTTNPKDYIELLAVFHIGLTNGIIDKSEIVNWADEIIQKDSEPDYFIIEVSLSGHKNDNELISLLNEYIGENKPAISGRVILGLLYTRLIKDKLPLDKIISVIYRIVRDGELNEKDEGFLYGLDEDYCLAEDGIIGSIEEVKEKTIEILEIYKDLTIENFKNWNEINIEVNTKVNLLAEKKEIEIQKFFKEQNKSWWKFWQK